MSDYKIDIKVKTQFLEEHSDSNQNDFAFFYTITLSNTGKFAAKLLNRHWIITDGNGIKKEIYGKGVVGEQPRIEPGESYTYSSGAMLKSPVGSMQGIYLMQADDGYQFDAIINPFRLSIKSLVH